MIKVRKYWNHNASFDHWENMHHWLLENVGMSGRDCQWDYDSTRDYMDLTFKDQQEAALFILKWM